MWPTISRLWLALSDLAPRKSTPRRRPAFRRPLLEALETRAVPSACMVTTTADGVPGSLRNAINQINADTSHTMYPSPGNSSVDEIDFAITAASDAVGGGTGYNATTGVATIAPFSELPSLINAVIIDGYTQGYGTALAASPNTLASGDNAVLKIVLDGSLAGAVDGLVIAGGNSTVRGLVIDNFGSGAGPIGTGIRLIENDSDLVAGNFIGTNATGLAPLGDGVGITVNSSNNTIGGTSTGARNIISGNSSPEGAWGIDIDSGGGSARFNLVEGNCIGTDISGGTGLGRQGGIIDNSAYNTIGGTTAAARNIISGNAGTGIAMDQGSFANVVQGNYIGTDATGTLPVPNNNAGINLSGTTFDNTIGGTQSGAGNVISGNVPYGILLNANGNPANNLLPTDNNIQGNLIGTDKTGAVALGNSEGIELNGANNDTIGGTVSGAGNTIAFNRAEGVRIDAGTGDSILGNSIFTNSSLGIFLNSPNNANNNQAAPVLTAVYSGLGLTIVTGTITSVPSATVTVQFFANAAGDPEGRTLIGSQSVPTDSAGNGSFTAVFSAPLPTGQGLGTATVTDPNGNTSEFSASVTATPLPPSSLSGIVWEDFNDDGQVDFGEKGISGVTVSLAGTDFIGRSVNLSQPTDGDGAYVFLNLLPGNYTITETQPAGYLQGIDSVGTAGGSLSATDQFSVCLDAGVDGLNYNFGEQLPAGGGVQHGQTAGIGFWNNKNGQALIKALPVVTNADGSVTSVANWLAATLPNTFGASAGSNNLSGKSNAAVAALFQQDFVMKGVKLDAQVLATALSVYATNATLDATGVAASYGFTVSGDGAGTATVSVGSNGDAFGVANNTTLTLVDLLRATDAQAVNGILYNGNTTRRNEANNVYSAVNQAGNIN
jgi:hypothetical protein